MKKQNHPLKSFHSYFSVLTIFLIFLFVSNIYSQVIINEKVEIGGLPSENNSQDSSSIIYRNGLPFGFIMPKSGELQIGYNVIWLLGLELPDYSTFNTYFFKGDSSNIDTLSNIFALYDTYGHSFYDSCNQEVRFLTEWVYFGEPYPVYMADLGYVTEGDSVQFTYHSDMWGEEADIPLWEAVEVWDDTNFLWLECTFAYEDSCLAHNPFIQELYIFVTFREDELVVSIEPDEIAPGDTAEIVLKKKLIDGALEDFDSTQTFEVGMLEGCMSGKLLVGTPSDTGSYFYKCTSADQICSVRYTCR